MFQLQSRLGESDLIKPNRILIKEGDILKISRNTVNSRYLVLFNDCILYAKKNATGDLRVSQNIRLIAAKAKVEAKEKWQNKKMNKIVPYRYPCRMLTSTHRISASTQL